MKNLVTAHGIRSTPAKLGCFGQWIHFRIEIVGCGWGWGWGVDIHASAQHGRIGPYGSASELRWMDSDGV